MICFTALFLCLFYQSEEGFSHLFTHTHTYILLSRFYFFYSHFNRYNIVFLAFTYGIPMVVMIICYTVMGRELWGSQSIGETSERQTESMKSKKKVSVKHLLYIYMNIAFTLLIFSPSGILFIFAHCVRAQSYIYTCII